MAVKHNSFHSWPYPIGISSIARNFPPYSGGRVWAEPTKMADTNAFIVMQKILKTCITFSDMGIL